MDPTALIWVVAALLAVLLIGFAVTRRPRRPGPPPRKARDPVERWWDTPEHSDAWEEDAPPANRTRGG